MLYGDACQLALRDPEIARLIRLAAVRPFTEMQTNYLVALYQGVVDSILRGDYEPLRVHKEE